MPESKELPIEYLRGNHRKFVDEWEISKVGIFVPPKNEQKGVYVWAGSYADDETVVIVATERASQNIFFSALLVGIANEAMCTPEIQAENEIAEFQANSATYPVSAGLRSAIYLLNLLKGLPDGTQLHMTPTNVERIYI